MFDAKIGKRWGFLAVISISLSAALPAAADTRTLQSVQVQEGFSSRAQIPYSGQLDGVREGGRQLIIDDTLLNVSPMIRLNGATISRERLAGKLSEGETVRFQLSGENFSAPEIVAIQTQ